MVDYSKWDNLEVSSGDEKDIEPQLKPVKDKSGSTTLTPEQTKFFAEKLLEDDSGVLKTLSEARKRDFIRERDAFNAKNDAYQPGPNVFGVKAVMVSCNGDTKYPRDACYGDVVDSRFPRYRRKGVGSEHQVFENFVSPLSELLGRPVHLLPFMYPPVPAKADKSTHKANHHAAFLLQNLDASTLGSCLYPIEPGSTWNVMVVRQDKDDIDPDFVRALCDFALVRVSKVVTKYKARKITKEEVAEELTPAMFFEFVNEMRVKEYHENYQGEHTHAWLQAYYEEVL